MNDVFVLDACALIALLQKEVGAEVVRGLYRQAKENNASLRMNRLNLLEVYYGSLRAYGAQKTADLMKFVEDSPIQIISELSDPVFQEAGRLKAAYRISLADSIALAETSVQSGALVTSDHHEFDVIEQSEPIKFLWIR